MAQQNDDSNTKKLKTYHSLESYNRVVISRRVKADSRFDMLQKLKNGFTYGACLNFFYPGNDIICCKCKDTSHEVKFADMCICGCTPRNTYELSKICVACLMRSCRWIRGVPCSDCMVMGFSKCSCSVLDEENEEPDEVFIRKVVEHFNERYEVLTKAAR